MDRYGVLVFHDQHFTDDTQMAFSRNFGDLETASGELTFGQKRRVASDLVNDISNLDNDNRIRGVDDRKRLFRIEATGCWHSGIRRSRKCRRSSLCCQHGSFRPLAVTAEFADMRAAYDTLDDETKAECEGLVCEHSQLYSRSLLGFTDFTEQEERQRFKPVLQRLVRTHPSTGRKSLYLASHAGAITGWPVPEARAFLRDLIEHATQRAFVYAHQWKQWDLVVWDNRATMHRARPFPKDQVRDMHRTTVACERSTMAEAA